MYYNRYSANGNSFINVYRLTCFSTESKTHPDTRIETRSAKKKKQHHITKTVRTFGTVKNVAGAIGVSFDYDLLTDTKFNKDRDKFAEVNDRSEHLDEINF